MTPGTSHGTGRTGERLVRALYEARGWRCTHANYRAGPREIDLVMAKGAAVAFVEVKTRAGDPAGEVLEQVGPRKIQRVTAAARHWIHHHGGPGQRYRFDVAGVRLAAGETEIRVMHDAWRIG